MITKRIIAILRAEAPTSRGPEAPDTTTPFVINVETHEGPAVLQIVPLASAEPRAHVLALAPLHQARCGSASFWRVASLPGAALNRQQLDAKRTFDQARAWI
jgi:hypothetical protein